MRYRVIISDGDHVAIFGEYATLADVEIAIRKWEIANPGSEEGSCAIHDLWAGHEWINRNTAREALRAFAGGDEAPIVDGTSADFGGTRVD